MNLAVTNYLTSASNNNSLSYSNFKCVYDSVKQKILIGNFIDSFELTFDSRIYYDNDNTRNLFQIARFLSDCRLWAAG